VDKKEKKKPSFFQGYGYNAPVKIYDTQYERHPELQYASYEMLRWCKAYLWFGFVLAFLIPESIFSYFPPIQTYVNWMGKYIRFIEWIGSVSAFPHAAQTWYAIMFPAFLPIYLRFFSIWPFRFAPVLTRSRISLGKHILGAILGCGLAWGIFGTFVDASNMPAKSYSMGHGRLYIALIADYRLGLALFGPILMIGQFLMYLTALLLLIMLPGRFVFKGEELP